MKPIAKVLWWPGTNCHHETMYALKLAGARPQLSLINRLTEGKEKLYECDLLLFAGGFARGDHIRAAAIPAIELQYLLGDQLQIVLERGIPMAGICNGFQIMAYLGLFGDEIGNPNVLLDMNESGTFEHRWKTVMYIHHVPGCPWTESLDGMKVILSSGHGEGLVVTAPGENPWSIAATYGSMKGEVEYSPNGGTIAGITYKNRYGQMPHWERAIFGEDGAPQGLLFFQNGVRAVK